MSPLMSTPTPSLNTERSQLEASMANPLANAAGPAGGFADVLKGLGAGVAPTQTPTPAAPPVAKTPEAPKPSSSPSHEGAQAATKAEAGSAPASARGDEARRTDKSRAEAKFQDAGESDTADAELPGTDDKPASAFASAQAAPGGVPPTAPPQPLADSAPTLAHWLLGGALGKASSGNEALPPPDDTAAPSDDWNAASITRDLMQGLRAGAGKGGGAVRGAGGGADFKQVAEAAEREAPAAGAGLALAAGATGTGSDAVPQVAGLVPGSVAGEIALPNDLALVPVAEHTIQAPVGSAGFGDEVSLSIARFTREGLHEVKLQLNPVELGPLAVHIAVSDGSARIDIDAAHAATRQALEATMPALAEAMKADGLALAAGRVHDMSTSAGADLGAGMGSSLAGDGAAGGRQGRPSGDGAAARDGADPWRPGVTVGLGTPPGAATGRGWSSTAAGRFGGGAGGGLDLYA